MHCPELCHIPTQFTDALDAASLPSVLVSCKGDVTPPYRQLDPHDIEKRVKAVLKKINTLQVSSANTGLQKQSILLLLKIVSVSNTGRFANCSVQSCRTFALTSAQL